MLGSAVIYLLNNGKWLHKRNEEIAMKKICAIMLGIVMLNLAACGSSQLNEKTEVSKCREDLPFASVAIKQALQADDADVQTERLLWAYDKGTKTLSLMHDNLCNDCGPDWEYSLALTKDDKGYSLVSLAKDTSKDGYKCGSCRYDLKTSAVIDEDASINLTFTKKTDGYGDNNGEKKIWSGKIDLATGSGEIVINNNLQCM